MACFTRVCMSCAISNLGATWTFYAGSHERHHHQVPGSYPWIGVTLPRIGPTTRHSASTAHDEVIALAEELKAPVGHAYRGKSSMA